MTALVAKANADPALAAVPIATTQLHHAVGTAPVLATPATIVAVAAGVTLVGGLAGLFVAGYQIGHIGPRPPIQPN